MRGSDRGASHSCAVSNCFCVVCKASLLAGPMSSVMVAFFVAGYLSAKLEPQWWPVVSKWAVIVVDLLFAVVWSMLRKPPQRRRVYRQSTKPWVEELNFGGLDWISANCANCDAWGSHQIHAACFHVYHVRNNGNALGALRTCSTTRNAYVAFERAGRLGGAVHVIDVLNENAMIDMPRVTASEWFSDLCDCCLRDPRASSDVIEWSTYLEEVVLDRCAVNTYVCRSVTYSELTVLQRIACFLKCKRLLALLM